MCGLSYNPQSPPPTMPERRTARVLQSLAPNQQKKSTTTVTTTTTTMGTHSTSICTCASELAVLRPEVTELRNEVVELTRALNEMKEVMYARLLFPHMSLAEAQTDATEVTWEHVRPPKRQRSDSALYLPDIPDGFSDSTAHSLVFKQRTRNAEKECERACKKFKINPVTGEPLEKVQRVQETSKAANVAEVIKETQTLEEGGHEVVRVTRRMAVVIEPPPPAKAEKGRRGRASTLRVGRGRK